MSTHTELSALNDQLKTLTASVLASEQRMQRMERRNRFVFSGMLGALGLSVYLGVSGLGVSPALAENAVERDIHAVEQDAKADVAKARADFNALMENMRHDLTAAEKAGANAEANAGKLIAVLLHDIKATLEAVPAMASNMETMSRDMTVMTANVAQMNGKLTVMTGSINSTMGRMGRMMPWW
ncbi:MAG: hypothetical protein H6980_04750 [Gammaproteobacteria bacterium]|nr:hypothetical protein [Gammaproteobacteria bacterium]